MVVLYREKSEHRRAVEEFAREFERRTSKKLDLIDIDMKQGSDMAELYDITEYPAVLATADGGSLQNMWMGEPLPLINEVAAYVVNSDG